MGIYNSYISQEIDLCNEGLQKLEYLVFEHDDYYKFEGYSKKKGLSYFLKYYQDNFDQIIKIQWNGFVYYDRIFPDHRFPKNMTLALCTHWHLQESKMFLETVRHYLQNYEIFPFVNIATAGKFAHQEIFSKNINRWFGVKKSPFLP